MENRCLTGSCTRKTGVRKSDQRGKFLGLSDEPKHFKVKSVTNGSELREDNEGNNSLDILTGVEKVWSVDDYFC